MNESELSKKLLALRKGCKLTVKTHQQRTHAHQIALRNDLKIKTRSTLEKDGFEIWRIS